MIYGKVLFMKNYVASTNPSFSVAGLVAKSYDILSTIDNIFVEYEGGWKCLKCRDGNFVPNRIYEKAEIICQIDLLI